VSGADHPPSARIFSVSVPDLLKTFTHNRTCQSTFTSTSTSSASSSQHLHLHRILECIAVFRLLSISPPRTPRSTNAHLRNACTAIMQAYAWHQDMTTPVQPRSSFEILPGHRVSCLRRNECVDNSRQCRQGDTPDCCSVHFTAIKTS
jgi:hypothetical protein